MSKQEVTWRQWAMVCALTVLFIYAQIDSGSITLLVGPIKQDIGATDTQMACCPASPSPHLSRSSACSPATSSIACRGGESSASAWCCGR